MLSKEVNRFKRIEAQRVVRPDTELREYKDTDLELCMFKSGANGGLVALNQYQEQSSPDGTDLGAASEV